MSYVVVMANTEKEENLRVRLRPGLKNKVDEVFDRKQISQVDAINQLMQWFVQQDDLLQSVILGQVFTSGDDEVAKLILDRYKNSGLETGDVAEKIGNAVQQARKISRQEQEKKSKNDQGRSQVS